MHSYVKNIAMDRWQFAGDILQMHFHETKCAHFYLNFTDICSYWGTIDAKSALIKVITFCTEQTTSRYWIQWWSAVLTHPVVLTHTCINRPPIWILTHWPHGVLNEKLVNNLQANASDWWMRCLLWNCSQVDVTGPYRWYVNIGSGNGLLALDNKALPGLMLTKMCVAIWHNKAIMNLMEVLMNPIFDAKWLVFGIDLFSHTMMTSSNGNIFRVTGPIVRGIHRSRWIPHTKASNAELWCFLWSASE